MDTVDQAAERAEMKNIVGETSICEDMARLGYLVAYQHYLTHDPRPILSFDQFVTHRKCGEIANQNQLARTALVHAELNLMADAMDEFTRTFSGRPFKQNPQTYCDLNQSLGDE